MVSNNRWCIREGDEGEESLSEDMSDEYANVAEGPVYPLQDGLPSLRTFELSLRGVTAQVCSLGASLTSLRVPSPQGTHDVVLGYKSPIEMYESGNSTFMCAVVGRVANRIAKGRLQVEKGGKEIQLAINNDPNHLHGGRQGFSHKIWEAEIVYDDKQGTKTVKFSLLSENGDQGYPGTVHCSATYSLLPSATGNGVSLRLEMSAELQSTESTPINMAQHSYFNLSRHDDPQGVLDHTLTMPCNSYTPIDDTSIPTRKVISLNEDGTMDWRGGRVIRDAMENFALSKAGIDRTVAQKVLLDRSTTLEAFHVQPFGFDHNYVVSSANMDGEGLYLVGTLSHKTSKRTMRVRTSAPGVQLYTANYLSASDPSNIYTKDGAQYSRWQGVCLETQSFPDSVLVDETIHPDFAKGKCTILTPENQKYLHRIVYDLEYEDAACAAVPLKVFAGNDSDGNTYDSVQVMWQVEGVSSANKSDWYDRATDYYEANCPETVDGVLGGFASISDLDLEGSRVFLKKIEKLRTGWSWSVGAAAECGAGIGRVSKGLLLPLGVPRCDLVESSPRLLSAAPEYIGPEAYRCRFYCEGLQNWSPAKETYSIIWIQWVFCYLTDNDAIEFLRRCGEALVHGGVICLKENTCSDTDFVLDRDDASVTRSVPYLMHLIQQAGLRVVLQEFQSNFPEEIFPVPMIALEPVTGK